MEEVEEWIQNPFFHWTWQRLLYNTDVRLVYCCEECSKECSCNSVCSLTNSVTLCLGIWELKLINARNKFSDCAGATILYLPTCADNWFCKLGHENDFKKSLAFTSKIGSRGSISQLNEEKGWTRNEWNGWPTFSPRLLEIVVIEDNYTKDSAIFSPILAARQMSKFVPLFNPKDLFLVSIFKAPNVEFHKVGCGRCMVRLLFQSICMLIFSNN